METALVEGLYAESHKAGSRSQTLGQLLNEMELKMRGPYSKYNDRYGNLITELRALAISESKMHPASSTIDQMLQNDCHISNGDDRVIVSQAVRFMFTQNTWTAIVTNDHTDLLSNKGSIERNCLLLVCDPLYVFDEMREKFQLGLAPIEAAGQSSIDYKKLVRVPAVPPSIV